jgi:FKBP-type peptidyl-prolyl cis-trans isomerase
MNKHVFILAASLLLTVPALAQRRTASDQSADRLTTGPDSLSFALGYLTGKELIDEYPELMGEIDFAVFQHAFEQKLNGQADWLDDEKINSYIEEYFDAKRKALYQANIEAGERFLAQNRLDPVVTETASGLQYRIVTPGRDENERPRPYDDIHITYTGKTLDGEVFTSGDDEYSYPASENDGLEEGLQLMSPGAKYIFYIPSELAFGEEGEGGLKPYSVAIYEVEMDSMTRDHEYYDEEEDAVVDIASWSEENGLSDDTRAHVRPAGDYTATQLEDCHLSISVNGYDSGDIVKTYRVEGFTLATTEDKAIVLDADGREVFRGTLDEESNSYDSYYLTEFRAGDGAGPLFLVLDFGFDGGSYYGSMLYTIENDEFRQTDKYLALVNNEGGSERLSPILSLQRSDEGVEFRAASTELNYDPISDTQSVSGEDLWYVYRNGQITEAGPYTTLNRFRNR